MTHDTLKSVERKSAAEGLVEDLSIVERHAHGTVIVRILLDYMKGP